MNIQPAKSPASWSWQNALSRAELDELMRMQDWRSWLSVATNWGLILGSMALVAWAPNPLTMLLALFVIGARQLGLEVLMHEAAHRSLFRNRKVNDWVGNWLCAYPVWADLLPYRPYHLTHHAKNWTWEDPDLHLVAPFPITQASLKRKAWRDLSGQTGWKRAKATWLRDLGISKGRVKLRDEGSWRRLRGVATTNLVLLGLLTLAGYPALYLLWVVAWLTTHAFAIRVRAIAEHSMVPEAGNALRNTRTVLARWWERLLIAPNRVNFHLEHHLIMTMPHYNLPKFHRLLRERGVLDSACVAHGYREVLQLAASA